VSAPLDALRRAFGSGTPKPDVCGAPQNVTFNQFDLNRTKTGTYAACCALCLELAGCNALTWNVGRAGNCYLKREGRQAKPSGGHSLSSIMGPPRCAAGEKCVTYNPGLENASVAAAAAAADVSIVFISTYSGEGRDRATLGFDPAMDALVELVAAHSSQTVVVAVSPGAVLTPWRSKVHGLIAAFMPGQEYGNAIADVLFGEVNPSAKLPLTFPDAETDYGFALKQWPGLPSVSPECMNWTTPGHDWAHRNQKRCDRAHPHALRPHGSSMYTEKLEVGYRRFDAQGIEPAFAFGAGLSYSRWAYSNLTADATGVSFTLANVGAVDGAEVAQVYLGFPPSAGEPPSQLKGFRKVTVKAGAAAAVTIPLTDRSFSTWDVASHAWKVAAGDFVVHVGSSSRDVRLTGKISM